MPKSQLIKILPSQEYLHECLDYDQETGVLTWKIRPREHFSTMRACSIWNRRFADKVAGTTAKDGYRSIKLGRFSFLSHRVIWKLETGQDPLEEIDHKNGSRADNRWTNLRPANRTHQCWNRGLRKDNLAGRRGVNRRANGKFQASIWTNGSARHLGTFDTPEEAAAAYDAAARELHDEYYFER